ncbi:hypothetical protein [Staphylococcus felis]|uniref:hypothetical protein n=1 Tax=Staphylococcus felis TaxID=46127 RepID=UPI000CD17719|nr:hypothetical protein [Staphylococcus felis]AVP37465.1 hypothetical protein C7J90_11045 [Staphylococcus felis]PNZ36227.1 hypothetical protein CD143_04475 [Staphylococcus felis]QQB02585.1 hypothetical protein I6H71_07455 [Staphylococcus felis]
MRQLNLTNHAYQRYLERVSDSSKRHEAANKLSQLVSTAKERSIDETGKTTYYAKGLAIVVSEDGYNVLTVYRKTRFDDCDLFENIIEIVKREVYKEERYLNGKKRSLLIEMHEAEIRKLKVFNPETQSIIQNKIDFIKTEISNINDKLRQAKDVSKKFGLT